MEKEKTILMGDFNTTPENKVLKPIRERLKDTDGFNPIKNHGTYPSDKPDVKIDYIFYKGLTCIKTETIEDLMKAEEKKTEAK